MTTTTPQMQPGASKPEAARPEFCRLPPHGAREQFTGLSRAYLYDLINAGQIKTVSLRQRGKARGVRLIVYDSLMDYINRCAQEAN